jgi:hypothetical protein
MLLIISYDIGAACFGSGGGGESFCMIFLKGEGLRGVVVCRFCDDAPDDLEVEDAGAVNVKLEVGTEDDAEGIVLEREMPGGPSSSFNAASTVGLKGLRLGVEFEISARSELSVFVQLSPEIVRRRLVSLVSDISASRLFAGEAFGVLARDLLGGNTIPLNGLAPLGFRFSGRCRVRSPSREGDGRLDDRDCKS